MRTGLKTQFLSILLVLFVVSCAGNNSGPSTIVSNSNSIAETEVIFQAKLPSGLPENVGLAVEILDETTGLSFNPTRYQMQSIDPLTYFVRVVVPIGSVLKYRYVKITEIPTPEYSSFNVPIRYRLYSISGPSVIYDSIAAWIDSPFSGPTGTLEGQVIADNNVPVPGILVMIDGLSTLTASDGTFSIDRIPIGEHNLVAYSLDGAYQVFQQGAVIAENALTPAIFQVSESNYVNVTFSVTVPEGDYSGVPIRLIGNLYQFGNTYSDQAGGLSTIASRAPALTQITSNTFGISMLLPAGTYLEYKYTLGDGFWNAEHTIDGAFTLRKVIVPTKDTTFRDTVITWSSIGFSPITFSVTVPAETPASDSVSIQFNPYTWTNPIPMWSLGNNQWYYTLYSPLDYLAQTAYRFCRNDQCGNADNQATVGSNPSAPTFTPSTTSQSFTDIVSVWNLFGTFTPPTLEDMVNPRSVDFISGAQLSTANTSSSRSQETLLFSSLAQNGANWLFITPTWSVVNINPPRISPIPGSDPLWSDIESQISAAVQSGLQVAVYPHLVYENDMQNFWLSADRSDSWWDSMFAQYRRYVISFVDLAAQNNLPAVILGGTDALALIPNGVFPDGSGSHPPDRLLDQWNTLLNDIRARYAGRIIWAIPYPDGANNIPPFINQVDAVYIEVQAPLVQANYANIDELGNSFSSILQQFILPIQQNFTKPVIAGVAYPSADGAAAGCVTYQSSCVDLDSLNQPSMMLPYLTVDISEQADIYTAVLRAANQAGWLNGLVSIGFFAPVKVLDASLSVYGKPAEEILFHYFRGW